MDIYSYNEKTGAMKRLTTARGYDAEGSYSPDGKWIVFSSMRSGYDHPLTDKEKKSLEENPSNFADIYIMKADGTEQKRLTNVFGYDGGPFFTQDGKKIVWRRFDEQGLIADVWMMNIDGSDQKQITTFGSMSWAPYMHPSGEYIHFRVEQARIRKLRALHGGHGRHEGTGPGHLLARIRRPARALPRRQDARLDVEPRRRFRGPAVPRTVEPREGDGSAEERPAQKAGEEIMRRKR